MPILTSFRRPRRRGRRRGTTLHEVLGVVRMHVLPNVLFAVPAYFASKFIQQLGGGALWFPKQWRDTVGVFGLLVGLAVFNYARAGRGHADPGLAVRKSSGAERAAPSKGHEGRAQLRSLRWYALALVALCAYIFLRHQCVYSWSPRAEWLALNEVTTAGAADLPSFVELQPQRLDSVHASDVDEIAVWRGSFLVPLFFSTETRAALEAIELETGRDPILYCLESNEEWLIDRIRHYEGTSMAVTTTVFLVVHLAVLVFACMGFGGAFSASEELATELAHRT